LSGKIYKSATEISFISFIARAVVQGFVVSEGMCMHQDNNAKRVIKKITQKKIGSDRNPTPYHPIAYGWSLPQGGGLVEFFSE